MRLRKTFQLFDGLYFSIKTRPLKLQNKTNEKKISPMEGEIPSGKK